MDEDSLEKLARSGGTYDSSGSFTIDWSRAQVKLGRYQLSLPGAYLLKLVQAGVRFGVAEIRIALARDHVQVDFLSPEPVIDCQAVLDLLARPLAGQGDDALALLGIGLNGAPAEHIAFRDHHRGQGVHLGDEPSPLDVAPQPGLTSFFIARRAGAAERAAEHAGMWGRTTFCPVPIRLDGRVLNQRAESPFYRGLSAPSWAGATVDLVLGEALAAGSGLAIPACRPAVVARDSKLEPTGTWNPSTFLLLDRRARDGLSGCYVLIPLALTGESQVHLVQYGVVLETLPIELTGGARAAVSVDGWPTDLGGLQLRDRERLNERFREAEELYRLLSGTLRASLSRLPLAFTQKDSTLHGGFTGTIVGLGAGLLFGPTLPLAAGVAVAGGLLGLAGGWLSSQNRRTAQLKAEILKRLPS